MDDYNSPAAFGIADFMMAFSVSRAHVYRLIKAGKLQAVKTGGKTLIPAESAKAWFASLPPMADDKAA